MGAMPDLTRGVTFNGLDLNDVTTSPTGNVGCEVSHLDPSEVDVVQFTEKLALVDGLDCGMVSLGGRKIVMSGTVYGSSRGDAFDRLAALEDAMNPSLIYQNDKTTFGYLPLEWYTLTAGGPVLRTVNVRPNGLRYQALKGMFGGPDATPLAIPWSVTMLAKDPTIS